MKNIKLKFLRALSLLLASLFIINPFGTSPQMLEDKAQIDNSSASSKIIDENNKLISSEGISGHDDRITFQKVVENYTNMLITSGVVVISGLGLLINYAVTNAQHTINPKELIDQYINDPLPSPVSADMWFTRLGSNQEFINCYKDLANQYNDDTLDIGLSDDDKRTIKVDLPRTFPSNNPEDNRKLRPIIKRIIYIVCGKIYTYYHYWQGYNYILVMVCSKFLQTLSNVDDITNNMETEAKICYVFSELLRVCHQDNKDDSALVDISTYHDLINKFEISISAKEREHLNNIIDYASKLGVRNATIYTMAKKSCLLIDNLEPKTTRSTEANALYTNSIKIWDRIISDDNMLDKTTNKLDYKKALQTLFNIQLSLLLERSQNTDLKRLSSTDLMNFIAHNDKPVLPTR